MQEWFLPISNVCTLVTLNYIAMKLRNKVAIETYDIVTVPLLTGLACIIMMLQPLPPSIGLPDLRFAPLVMAGLCSGFPIAVLSVLLPAAYSYLAAEPQPTMHLLQDLLAPAVLSSLFHNRDYRSGFLPIRLGDGFKTLALFFFVHVLFGIFAEQQKPSGEMLLSQLYMLVLSGAAIVVLIRMYNDENKTWLLQRRLELQANQDGLTRLANLRSFLKLAEKTLAQRRIAIFMIDIDNFKLFNDRFGHLAGDDLLREVGGLLRNVIETHDYVARYGGEEFILMSLTTDYDALAAYARLLCDTVSSYAQCGFDREDEGADVRSITISIGISVAVKPGDSLQRLIHEADQALYASKRGGKNRYTFHTSGSLTPMKQSNA
jgi:diguanylate cyclase